MVMKFEHVPCALSAAPLSKVWVLAFALRYVVPGVSSICPRMVLLLPMEADP